MREYWLNVSLEVADEEEKTEEDYPYGFGSRITLTENNNWRSKHTVDLLNRMLDDFYKKEKERDRKKAEPFWLRWLGA